jgi:hypothetical protein
MCNNSPVRCKPGFGLRNGFWEHFNEVCRIFVGLKQATSLREGTRASLVATTHLAQFLPIAYNG